jgi:hypothetical protein
LFSMTHLPVLSSNPGPPLFPFPTQAYQSSVFHDSPACLVLYNLSIFQWGSLPPWRWRQQQVPRFLQNTGNFNPSYTLA